MSRAGVEDGKVQDGAWEIWVDGVGVGMVGMFRSARSPCRACDETSGSSADSLEADDMLENLIQGAPPVRYRTGGSDS